MLPQIVTYTGGRVMRPDLCDAKELLRFPIEPVVYRPTSAALNLFASDCVTLCKCNAVQVFSVGMGKSTVSACEAMFKDGAPTLVTGLAFSLNLSGLRFDLPEAKHVCIQVVVSDGTVGKKTGIYRKNECINGNQINMPTNFICVSFDADEYVALSVSCQITVTYLFC